MILQVSDKKGGEIMKLGDMIKTLRTIEYERIELRTAEGNELLTAPAYSEVISSFTDYVVTEWFPHGAPNSKATFTVYIRKE